MNRWNPLDTWGRRRLLKEAVKPEHIGDATVRAMLESPETFKMRKTVVEASILAFFSIWFDPFNSLREHLLLPVFQGEQKPEAVVNVESPAECHPLTPLIVPRIHT